MKRTLALTSLAVALAAGSVQAQSGPGSAELFEWAEWSVSNASWGGNPFDLNAEVNFTHAGSGETRTTQMFYDGGNDWKFRFTGTQTGTWNYTTSSGDGDLNGLSGSINVLPNPDPNARGFLTQQGNKFAVQTADGLKGYIFNAFQHSGEQRPFVHDFANTTTAVDDYTDLANDNGFEVNFLIVGNNWFDYGSEGHDEHSSTDPDITSFERIEQIISRTHTNGNRTMIWAWGDEARKWTPIGVGEGINGTEDRRLQRYIAARLGPLPGWSMGYGFDLHEYISKGELRSWQSYLQDHFGWQHLLSARATDLQSSDHMNGYAITDTEHGDFYGPSFPDVSTIRNQLSADTDNPHLYEERHIWQRWGLNETDTRRLTWRTAIAGGMGGWYGFFGSTSPSSYPDSLKDALRTHHTFWHDNARFMLDFVPADHLTAAGDAYVLATSDDQSLIVIYQEGTDEITVDLSGYDQAMEAIGVDTTEAYDEVDLGTLENASGQVISLPTASDWAVAITPIPEPATLSLLTLGGLSVLVRRRRR